MRTQCTGWCTILGTPKDEVEVNHEGQVVDYYMNLFCQNRYLNSLKELKQLI